MTESNLTLQRHCPICGRATGAARCPDDGAETVVMTGFTKDALTFKAGDVVAGTRYVITGVLGKGGFGAVYAAEHTGTKQPLALKMLTVDPSTAEDDVVRRFYREAQITAQLRSRHTVRVFDIGQADNGPLFLAMELLRGPTLEQILRKLHKLKRNMSEAEAIDVAVPILKSLAEAHKVGLVHRDLKPANIMLADLGEDEPVTKVLDFGIARTEDSSLTAAGKALGTPAYMSPEQCAGKALDGRSDLYSLGAILFRCVTGRLPFVSQNTLSLMFMHANEPLPDLRELAGQDLSEGFVTCIETALAKQPSARFANAREMRVALEGVRGGAWAGTPARPHDVMPAQAPALDPAEPRGPKRVPPMPHIAVDDEPPTLITPAAGQAIATAGMNPGSTSGLVDLVFESDATPSDAPSIAPHVTPEPEDIRASLDTGTRVDTDSVRAPPTSDGDQEAVEGTPRGKGRGLWIGLAAISLGLVGVGGWLATAGDDEPDRHQASAARRQTEDRHLPMAPTAPKETKAESADDNAATRTVSKTAPRAKGIDMPEAPIVSPTDRATAQAKAQLAATTTKLTDKIRYLSEATKLDPTHVGYPVQLKVFREELARQRAAATKSATPQAQVKGVKKIAPSRPRVHKATKRPTKKANVRPKPKETEGGSDKVFIPAID